MLVLYISANQGYVKYVHFMHLISTFLQYMSCHGQLHQYEMSEGIVVSGRQPETPSKPGTTVQDLVPTL